MTKVDLAAIFESQLTQGDYAKAMITLKQLQNADHDDPWLLIFEGRLDYAMGKVEQAEAIFRDVLKSQSQTKLLAAARQGLKVIEDAERQYQKERIDEALQYPENRGLGFLAIQPVAPELKKAAALKLARIFRLDPYTAQTQIPSRSLRILRTGIIGELGVYGELLRQANVPTIWVGLEAIAQIPVYTVEHFELAHTSSSQNSKYQVYASCQSISRQPDKETTSKRLQFAFNWNEVSQRIEAFIPTFGEVVDLDAKRNLIRKEQVLDKVQICDLHLPQRGCILRFHDNCYRFDRGVQLEVQTALEHIAPTVQERWVSLTRWLDQVLPNVPIERDFQTFADMALAFPDFLNELDPHIELYHSKDSPWDSCFHLFSGMIFLKGVKHEG